MKAVTSYEMGVIEQKAIKDYNIPSLLLMENAAIGFVNELQTHYGSLTGSKIMIFCGKGNNGGDGFAAARHLMNKGAEVRMVLLGAVDELKPDAKTNYDIAVSMSIPAYDFINPADRPKIDARLMTADIAVDAMFGTGFRGTLEGSAAEAAGMINESECFVAAVDMVSGAESDTGKVNGCCVTADLTVTFALPKIGHLIYPARELCGTVVVTPISIPDSVIKSCPVSGHALCGSYARRVLPARRQNSHKGTFGKVFVLAGSKGLTGAAVMSSESVLAAGAGMVTAGIPAGIAEVVAANVCEVMTCPLPEMDGALSKTSLPIIAGQMERNNVLLMGCGVGSSPGAVSVMRRLIRETEAPMVIDADGINALRDNLQLLSQRRADIVLTPHPAEFAHMTGIDVETVVANRVDIARRFALDFKVSLVLKGADTVVAHPDGSVYINTSGNSGMATAGSGDVLAGLIAGLAAQGITAGEAANLGVYLHGLAGDYAAEKYGEYSMTARNILECVRDAFFDVLEA